MTSGAIYTPSHSWQDIYGLQIHGVVNSVESPTTWGTAWQFYQEKLSFVRHLKTIVSQNQMRVLPSAWVRLLDISQEFGFKQEYGTTQSR